MNKLKRARQSEHIINTVSFVGNSVTLKTILSIQEDGILAYISAGKVERLFKKESCKERCSV